MNSQYIYLLQEREFIKSNENIYKVGRTEKENHKRFNQYPKGSILLFQMICNNCKKIERDIIENFKKNFRQRKDIGSEYFQGKRGDMIDFIYLSIKKEENSEELVEETEEENTEGLVEETADEIMPIDVQRIKSKQYQKDAFKIVCENIANVFPNYLKDEVFGGNKKFFKIEYDQAYYYTTYYINPKLKSLIFTRFGSTYIGEDFYDVVMNNNLKYEGYDSICENKIGFAWPEEYNYFDILLKKQIIVPNKIYDLNSKCFMKQILNNKIKIQLENYDEFICTQNIKINNTIYNKIQSFLNYNSVLNSNVGLGHICPMVVFGGKFNIKKVKNFESFSLYNDISFDKKDFTLNFYKINKKYYDESFLRKYTPYLIKWDVNNNYYTVNRDYEYIGISDEPVDFKCTGSHQLFCDHKPWFDKDSYMRYDNEYRKCLRNNSLKECLNIHQSTQNILKLLD
jgi:hypothetical protein